MFKMSKLMIIVGVTVLLSFWNLNLINANEPLIIRLLNNRWTHIDVLADISNEDELCFFVSPHWYDPDKDTDSSLPLDESSYSMLVVTVDVSKELGAVQGIKTFKDAKNAFSYNVGAVTGCKAIGFFDGKIVLVSSEVDGLTFNRNVRGINPIDQIFISSIPKNSEDFLKLITEDKTSNTPFLLKPFRLGERRPKSSYVLPSVFALSGIINKNGGYCLGLSGKKKNSNDTLTSKDNITLWLSPFTVPEFQIEYVFSRNNSPNLLIGNYSHVASSFFDTIPLLVYRNGKDGSIRVMDYDPQLMLTGSPSCQVTLPPKFQTHEVESLLLTSGKERAYLGVVFLGKKTDEPKTLFLFSRTKASTNWSEYHQFALPNDSLSPTMCLQGNDLFYAYLQPVVIENPPEIADKNGKTSTEKKLVIFKHTLNPNSIQPNKSAQPEPIAPRQWTSRDGQYSIEARYISATEEYVRLEKLEGKVITVEFSKLSYADQSYVKRQIELEMQTTKNKQEKP